MILCTKGYGGIGLRRDCDNVCVLSSFLYLFLLVFSCFSAVGGEAHKAGACF